MSKETKTVKPDDLVRVDIGFAKRIACTPDGKSFTGSVTNTDAGCVIHYVDGQWHRDNAPAVEYDNGCRMWYQYDKRHRDDGPAVVWAGVGEIWYQHGEMHRDDGPAFESAGGYKEWHLNGKKYPDEASWKKAART